MRHLTVYAIVIAIIAGYCIYKFGEYLFNEFKDLTSEYEDTPKINRQLDPHGIKRILLEKSYGLTKGNI